VAAAACAAFSVAACTTTGVRVGQEATPMFSAVRVTEHRGNDDLLTGGLGRDGLRAMTAPAFADPEQPTANEMRRRALWSNWRGIADLAPGGGYGELYGSTASVSGREFNAMATVPGASQPHRVLVQVPDAFNAGKRCIVVTASSGSRGIYGAIAVAGAWGLPKGCAVAYTDKGAGSDYFDLDAGQGARADVERGAVGSRADGLAFAPDTTATTGVAFKHAHSRDNPEAYWGHYVKQAAQFALQSLDDAFPQAAPFTFDNTRVIAVGISNGGGAVLRAAELDGSGTGTGRPDSNWLDAVVAGEPNVSVAGARPLYDYTTQAALLMPCALLDPALAPLPQPPMTAPSAPSWTLRCASLKSAGLVEGNDTAAQAASALARCRSALMSGARSGRRTHRPTAAMAPASIPAATTTPRWAPIPAHAPRPPPSARRGGPMAVVSRPARVSAWSIDGWGRRTLVSPVCNACARYGQATAPMRCACAAASARSPRACLAMGCPWWCSTVLMTD